jgi:hypothetical protein
MLAQIYNVTIRVDQITSLLGEIRCEAGEKKQTNIAWKMGHFQQLTRSDRFWNAPASECTRARSNILRPSGVRA